MQHPLELIKIARESRFKNPHQEREKQKFLSYLEKEKIQPYIDNVKNLSNDYTKLKNIVDLLKQEYDAEMAHIEKLKNLFNGD